MACTSMTIPTSPVAAAATDILKEQNGLRRSQSSSNLCKPASMQRSYSDNHLCYSVNRIRASSTQPKLKSSRSVGIFPFQISSIPNSLHSFLFDPHTSKDMSLVEKDMNMMDNSVEINKEEEVEVEVDEEEEKEEIKRSNWVETLLELRGRWKNKQPKESGDSEDVFNEDENRDCNCEEIEGGCEVCYESEEEGKGEVKYDRESFSKLLVRVSWSETKLFSRLAFLCNMAYVIPEIKANDLKKYQGLQFVTSSLVKKAEAAAIKEKLDQDSVQRPVIDPEAVQETGPEAEINLQKEEESKHEQKQKHSIRPYLAYEIAASAASYVQSRAKDLLYRGSESRQENDSSSSGSTDQLHNEVDSSPRVYKQELAACMAASTMTTVVAAGEKEKQETADQLQSLHSSPCEWFICDDTSTYTRCFIIQGSDSLASWQANLFFEPTKFEGTDVLVHRGIYEAAKGIYNQFLPEIIDHLERHGERGKLQFTGHSLGGSLSLLISLMLLTNKVVKPSTLHPVVTFGSPFVFCGGQKILDDLGLDESHVHCVMMHRDIVPRAFSCNYPNHVASVLKRLTGSFRSHPCLNKKKVLYTPLGKLFILQPNESSSPPHPLLPPGNALYALGKDQCEYSTSALRVFLNTPHPLETLSDPTAYGSDGTILRDHDSSNYLKAVNGVLRRNTKLVVRKVRKQRNLLWPLLTSPSPHSWSHENFADSSRLVTKEVSTGV